MGTSPRKNSRRFFRHFYLDEPWTYRYIQLICNPGLEIKDGARAAEIARRELGMPGPWSKRRDRDVIRRASPLGGSGAASPSAASPFGPASPFGGSGGEEGGGSGGGGAEEGEEWEEGSSGSEEGISRSRRAD